MRKFVGSLAKKIIHKFGYDIFWTPEPELIQKRTLASGIEVLHDPAFRKSVAEVAKLTFLDTARLANLWQLSRMTNPDGAMIEIGSYRGGSALHLSNGSPDRRIYVCDTFSGFGDLPIDSKLDRHFKSSDFSDVEFASVVARWENKNRDVVWLKGYFPATAATIDMQKISFAHIDVDIYQSTIDTLEYLHPKFTERSIIVFDDYARNCDGMMKAVVEFENLHSEWRSFPVYPGQGMMIHKSWFDAGR